MEISVQMKRLKCISGKWRVYVSCMPVMLTGGGLPTCLLPATLPSLPLQTFCPAHKLSVAGWPCQRRHCLPCLAPSTCLLQLPACLPSPPSEGGGAEEEGQGRRGKVACATGTCPFPLVNEYQIWNFVPPSLNHQGAGRLSDQSKLRSNAALP